MNFIGQQTSGSLPFEIEAIRQLLAGSIWLESAMPVYHFIIDGNDWGWSPQSGIRAGRPDAPTCAISIGRETVLQVLKGGLGIHDLQRRSLISVGGLLGDAIALSKVFLPQDQQIERWKSLLDEPNFSLADWSTEGRRIRAERLSSVLDEIEVRYGRPLVRIRKTLQSWVEHRVDHCRLNQLVRFDFEGLETTPWEDSSPIDHLVRPSFQDLRLEAMSFLDGSVRAPHYGSSEDGPDVPVAGQPHGWRSYNIIEQFAWNPDRSIRFPKTAAILEKISESRTIMHAGFLLMESGVQLSPHCDGANWLLSYQFGLIVSEGCYLEVRGERRLHGEGRGLMFNDSFIHSAANESGETRVLLAVLCVNPQFSEMEREAMVAVVSGLPQGVAVYGS